MEQTLGIIQIHESIDMGLRNYEVNGSYTPLADLTPGSEWVVAQCDGQINPDDPGETGHLEWLLTVDKLTDRTLDFTLNGIRYTLNRQWQVLGTESIGIFNPYLAESARLIIFFSTNEGDADDFTRLSELGELMTENSSHGNIWKNIPLAREAMHLLKDKRKCCSTEQAQDFCKAAFKSYWIDEKETPRLYLSYLDFYHWLLGSTYYNEDLTYRLLDAINPEISDEQFLEQEKAYRSLLFDPIQRTPLWEEITYDVDKECDEILKDEPRFMGFCHLYWSTKRAVLAKHGIQWRSPSAMNPRVIFD